MQRQRIQKSAGRYSRRFRMNLKHLQFEAHPDTHTHAANILFPTRITTFCQANFFFFFAHKRQFESEIPRFTIPSSCYIMSCQLLLLGARMCYDSDFFIIKMQDKKQKVPTSQFHHHLILVCFFITTLFLCDS